MNDWGSGSYTSGWNANYILLAQAAQNEYDSYEKAEEILMLADIYKDDDEKLESIYRKALKTSYTRDWTHSTHRFSSVKWNTKKS